MTTTPTQPKYTPEELEAAQRLVEYDRAKKASDLAAKRTAYLAAVRGVVGEPAWATVRDGLAAIVSTNEADGLLSFHVNALLDIMGRLDKALPANVAG